MTDNKNFLDHVNDKTIESFEKETFEYTKKNQLPVVVLLIVAIILIGGLTVIFAPKTIMVDLSNLTIEETTTWAEGQNVMISSTDVYSESIEEGRVISQDTEEGAKLKDDAIVKVEVSDGLDPYGLIVVPEFDTSWSKGSLLNWVDKNGVLNFNIVVQSSEDVPEDYFISYRIIGADATDFNRSSEIEFVVNSVTEVATIEVPDFLDGTLTELDIWAKNNDVSYTVELEYNDIYAPEHIFYQSTMGGDVLNSDGTLHVKISKSYDRTPIEMVNLMNNNLAIGEIWLKNNQIPYTITYQYSTIYQDEHIIDQSIYEGVMVGIEDTVQLIVSRGEAFKVADFSEMNRFEAEQYLASAPYDIIINETYTNIPKGQFVSQSISGNGYIRYDQTLVVDYSLGNTVGIVDYRSLPMIDLSNWVDDQNSHGAALTLNIVESESNNIQSGHIIQQNIYNEYLPLDGVINVTVSSGLSIPKFEEMSKIEAINFNNQSLLTINVLEEYALGHDLGSFVSQSITPGVKGDQYTVVDVVYSLGQDVVIPNFTGLVLYDIDTWIREQNLLGADLTLKVHEQYSTSVPFGDIISQNVYNVYKALDTELEILISNGESYTVPDYRYYSQASIESNSTAHGVTVVFETVQNDAYASGRVVNQEPEPGTIMSKNDFLRIQIAE